MKRSVAFIVVALVAQLGLHAPAHADPEPVSFYVDPAGDHNASGDVEDPFRTIEEARDAIRELRNGNELPAGGVTVFLREGLHPRTTSFELDGRDSGTPEAPIVYRSYPGETARLTGGIALDRTGFEPVTDTEVLERIVDVGARDTVLQFDLAAAGITDLGNLSRHGYWHANDLSEVPPIELYVGGEGMTLARWPNAGTVQMGEIVDAGPTRHDDDLHDRGGSFTFTYDRPTHWQQADDIWMDGIFGYSWEWSYNKVESFDLENQTLTLRYGEMSGLMKTWFEDFHHFENLLEELDVPGEYYVDRSEGILYFQPNPTFTVGEGDVVVTMLAEPMLRTDGASHVTFDELVFEYGRATAAVILGGDHVSIANSEIRNFTDGGVLINSPGRYTYDGIPVNRGGTNHSVESSHLQHIGGVAVVLQGGDYATLTPGNNQVLNSHIHDFAYYHQAYNPGVLLDGVGNVMRGNRVHDAPHPGVLVHGNDHLIEYNEIYDVCRRFQDLGAIYMNAGKTPQQRGTVIRRNYFHDTGIGRQGVEGVYADNLTMGLLIEQNIFYRMGNDAIKNGSGGHITARNNAFIDTHIPYNNYEMWMGDGEGNTVDTDYRPAWVQVFEDNNDFIGTPYAERYPELLTFFDENHHYPTTNKFHDNVTWNPTMPRASAVNGHGARDVHELLLYSGNWVTETDPGFVDWQAQDFRLTDDAALLEAIPGFEPIPFDEIGPQGNVGHPSQPEDRPLQSVHLPASSLTLTVGATRSFAATFVPWDTTQRGVTYTSSNPSVVEVDVEGTITALAPGEVVLSVHSVHDSEVSDQATITVTAGEGIVHFTDFESGSNGWPLDGNRAIVSDDGGNHWYRITDGANGQLQQPLPDYTLDFRVKTPAEIPEGAVLVIYERSGETPAGYVRYRHAQAGSTWTLFDQGWGVLEEIALPSDRDFEPASVYHIQVEVRAEGTRLSVDGDLVLEGPNASPGTTGNVGFYVEGFTDLHFDDIRIQPPGPPDEDGEPEHAVIDLVSPFSDESGWTASEFLDFDGDAVRVTGEGVAGYQAETFADGLLRFAATFGNFDGGWYGFAVRSDRPGEPAWVNSNKGYLVVIKEDQIELQRWAPGQTMLAVVPNTVIEPGGSYVVEFGATTSASGTAVSLRVDGQEIWSGLDTDSGVGASGFLNVYHYAGTNELVLEPAPPPVPQPVDDSLLSDDNRGGISVPPSARPGERVEVKVGEGSEPVRVWLHSEPELLGEAAPDADGTVQVTIPESTDLGPHRLVVQSRTGDLIGWGPVEIVGESPSATPEPTASASPVPSPDPGPGPGSPTSTPSPGPSASPTTTVPAPDGPPGTRPKLPSTGR